MAPDDLMTLTITKVHRAIRTFSVTAAALFVAVVVAPEARAQLPSSSDQLRLLMDHRQEMSKRAVDETTKRRFEEGRSDTSFPLDGANTTKGGVVRALTPEQQ